MAEILPKQVDGLVRNSGQSEPVDLGSQNLTTTGTITASNFVGAGGGAGAWGGITGTLSDQTDLQSALDLKASITAVDELAQDAVGTILTDSSSIDFTYTDATPSITAVIAPSGVTNAMLAGSIASSKLVGTDITTVGTIATGTWSGTTVAVNRGGTGTTLFTSNRLLIGAGTSAISTIALGTANQILGMNSGATANEYKTLSVGTTGTDFAVAHSTGAIAFNLPSASSSNRGVVTTGAQDIAGLKTFTSIPLLPAVNPTTGNEATRKAYVDAIAASIDPSLNRLPCRVATTGAGTLATSFENGDVIDGITLATGDRILIKDQVAGEDNGIYIVAVSGAPTRATDSDTAAEVAQGTSTYVINGTGKGLYVQINIITTLGTDALSYALVGSPTDYVFGVGTTGTDFNVDVSGADITFNLPTASATNRGAISTSDWSTFNAKSGVSGATVANRIAVFNDTVGTVKNSAFIITTNALSVSTGDMTFNTTNSAGNITTNAGAGTSLVSGGSVILYGGYSGSSGTFSPGNVEIYAGSSRDSNISNGGSVILEAGPHELGSKYGAAITLQGGRVSGATHLVLTSGNSSTGLDYIKLSTGGSSFYASLKSYGLTADRIFTFPDAAGTFAVSASGGLTLSATGDISPTTTLTPATDIQIFTSSGTWTKPAGSPKKTEIIAIGGGGGGGAGRKGAAATVRAGGAGGGGGGWATETFLTSILGATETVTVGTGGAGGASQTTNTTNGATGTAGTRTRFGGWFAAGAGNGGAGGGTGAATGGLGGLTFPGISTTTGAQGGSSSGSGAAGASGGSTQLQPSGGAAGGGITTGNVANAGGQGGSIGIGAVGGVNSGYATAINGASGGTAGNVGSNGSASPTSSGVGGGGGGGGGASTSTNAGAGGDGAYPGGGGGGGGSATNSVGNSGKGGDGGDGWLVAITTY